MQNQYLCVHCHYYQPPRGNPFSEGPLIEPDAAPFPNWNARITSECYQPNADLGNFEYVSYNIGETLLRWLQNHTPETYQKIIAADETNVSKRKVGNTIAQTMHHTILPLSRREDKITQVVWGQRAFEHRFGRLSSGIWLPEMAVDYETLEVLLENGVEWTILSEGQVSGKPPGAGPYWIRIPGTNKRIKVFVRDDQLSSDMAFNLGRFGGAGRWAREVLVPRKRDAGPLTLIAVDGETFGHHWAGEEHFLHWLVTYEANSAGYSVITLNEYLQMTEPAEEITLRENTAWSCAHGVGRWATGCPCTPGHSYWKGAVRRAIDSLRCEMDDLYLDEMAKFREVDAFALRNSYIDVELGKYSKNEFLKASGLALKSGDADRVLKLVEAQYYRQVMYASCVFFFPDLDSLSTVYGIANAARAIALTKNATGIDLSSQFRRDLSIATGHSAQTGHPITGAVVFDEVYQLSDLK